MKKIIILGSTGSIGTNTLDIIRRFPERFKVVGLAAGYNHLLLQEQIREFHPQIVSLMDLQGAEHLAKAFSSQGVAVRFGVEGAIDVARFPEGDLVVSGMVGAAGLVPTLAAIQSKKTLALANKETLVIAGEIMQREARRNNVQILPIDSEHSAIFQCLSGERCRAVKRIILTASGGPLLGLSEEEKKAVTPQEALAHPTWKMGPKISIDSATLMNKGFEMIEARWLFNLPPERIDVVIHRQSIIHSMVEFVDRSVIAQMGLPDMRIPISFALHYPERAPLPFPSLALEEIGTLTFEKLDETAFPLMGCAIEALKTGGTLPAVLNAANEVAVAAFLNHRIGFTQIHAIVRRTMAAHTPAAMTCLEDVIAANAWAQCQAEEYVTMATRVAVA